MLRLLAMGRKGRDLVGALAAASLAAGCASSWPSVTARADRAFAEQRAPVRTVDVLPLDVEVWVDESRPERPSHVRGQFDQVGRGAITGALARQGYAVAAALDWQGRYVGFDHEPAEAMTAEQLAATVEALSSYGEAVEAHGQLLAPHLPARLGASGADATLYVGGWAYVGRDQGGGTGATVGKGVVIGAVVVVVAVVAIAALSRRGGGGGGSGGKVVSGGGRAVSGGGRAGSVPAQAAGGAGRTAVRAVGNAGTSVARTGGKALRGAARLTGDAIASSGDAFGRTHTHIEVHAGRPAYYYQEPPQRRPGRSEMLVEMTLVDNRTGLVLWHARQVFPASAARPQEAAAVMDRILATLP